MSTTEIAAVAVACLLIVLDYASGLLKACKNHDLNSTAMREGLYHKGAYVLVLVLAEIIDHAQHYIALGFDIPLLVPVAIYIAMTEIVSILENLAEINPELGDSKLLSFFKTKTQD